MINSKKLLKKPSATVPNFLVSVIIVLAVIGLSVATFLTIEHLRGSIPGCFVVEGCQTVLSSKYAEVGPIPTAVFGIGYYLSILMLAALYLSSRHPAIMKLIGWLSFIGFIASLYLIYVQVWVIGSICMYCMTSATVSILLFLLDVVIWRRYLSERKTPA